MIQWNELEVGACYEGWGGRIFTMTHKSNNLIYFECDNGVSLYIRGVEIQD
jgi:hypothetical protein